MSPLLTTLEALTDWMQVGDPDCALVLNAPTPGGQDDRHNVPAEVAIFASPNLPGGCMVWGRSDLGWHPNHGERSAVSILLAMKEQA
jgi:hypothetical protein